MIAAAASRMDGQHAAHPDQGAFPNHQRLRKRSPWPAVGESISYEPSVNRVQQRAASEHVEKRHLYGYSGHTASQVVVTTLSGVLIGICGVVLQTGIEWLVYLRNLLLQPLFDASLLRATTLYMVVSTALVMLTSWCVLRFAPRASGAGVAAVMALLNGCAVPHLLSGSVFVAKYLGTMLSRTVCMALGPEGPMVHLGACVASLVYTSEHALGQRLSRLWQRWCGQASSPSSAPAAAGYVPLPDSTPVAGLLGSQQQEQQQRQQQRGTRRRFLFNPVDHREVCTAGAAAGLAAAFGAPIGGVLYSLEEASTHWSRKTGWRCFLCTTVATFTLAQLHPRSASGMLQMRGVYSLSNLQWLYQLPFILLVSAGGGLLGAVFNLLRIRLQRMRVRQRGARPVLLGAGLAAALTVLAVALLPAALGTCLQVPPEWAMAEVVRHNCPEGQYNDLGTALLGDAVWVIRSLLTLGSDAEPINKGNTLCTLSIPCYYSAPSLAAFCLTYLLLMVAASSTNVPGGLFMPAIMVGGSFGALVGVFLLTVLPSSWDIQPGLYALVAATATLGGVFRSSISLVVVVVEGTRGIDFMFGIIVAVLVSNYVAHILHPHGVYESELEQAKDGTVFFLRQEPPHALRSQTAGSIMAAPAIGFPPIAPARMVLQALQSTTHNGFVVYHPSSSTAPGSGRLEGLITRDQLMVLLQRGAYCDEQGRYLQAVEDELAFEAALDSEMQMAQALSSSGHPPSSSSLGLPEEDGEAAGPCGSTGFATPSPSSPLAGSAAQWDDLSSPRAPVDEAAAAAATAASTPGTAAGMPPLAHLNLLPFVNLCPLSVRAETPCPRVWQLFLALSLRHLLVVDSQGCALGMITRKDLDNAAGQGWWRRNPVAPLPASQAPPSWLSTFGQSALRSLAIPTNSARRLLSVLSHKLSVSPASAILHRGQEAEADEERASVTGGSDVSGPSPRAPDAM